MRIRLVVLLIVVINSSSFTQNLPSTIHLYVALNGNDNWSGKLAEPNKQNADGPFRTLEKAKDETCLPCLPDRQAVGKIRSIRKSTGLPEGGISVEIEQGTYYMNNTFELKKEDSRSESAPIVYCSYQDQKVIICGGKEVKDFKKVTDENILNALPERARGKVLEASLGNLNIEDPGTVAAPGDIFQLFYQDKSMTLARWPNEGFTTIADVVRSSSPADKNNSDVIIKYSGDEPAKWVNDKDVWLHGYWAKDWWDTYEKIESIDTNNNTFTLLSPQDPYVYTKGQRILRFKSFMRA